MSIKKRWSGEEKMGWVATQPHPHSLFVPHTIILNRVVTKKLLRVVYLRYVVFHPYDTKVYIAFAKKIPVLNAENAIFATVPPHLLFGHTKATVKNNQPNNITTLLAFILFTI